MSGRTMSWMNAAPVTFAGRSRRGIGCADVAIRRSAASASRCPRCRARNPRRARNSSSRARSAHRRGGTRHPPRSVPSGLQFSRCASRSSTRARNSAETSRTDRPTPRSTGCPWSSPRPARPRCRPTARAMRSERHVQLLGGDLRQRGDDALAELHLARPRGAPCGPVRSGSSCPCRRLFRIDERQRVAHATRPSRSMAAAFSTARRMRGCAPQRQRCLSSAATISARVGVGLRSSSALALIMMPDRQ